MKIPKGLSESVNQEGQTTQKKIEEHKPNWKPGVNSGAPEWYAVPAPLVAP